MIVIALLIGIGVLFVFNPEGAFWFPKCWFYQLTGLQCPACGTQRAIHQALHLNFAAAFKYNPFVILSMPYLLSLVVVQWFDPKNKLQKLRFFSNHRITVNIYLVLLILWWIIRNIIEL